MNSNPNVAANAAQDQIVNKNSKAQPHQANCGRESETMGALLNASSAAKTSDAVECPARNIDDNKDCNAEQQGK